MSKILNERFYEEFRMLADEGSTVDEDELAFKFGYHDGWHKHNMVASVNMSAGVARKFAEDKMREMLETFDDYYDSRYLCVILNIDHTAIVVAFKNVVSDTKSLSLEDWSAREGNLFWVKIPKDHWSKVYNSLFKNNDIPTLEKQRVEYNNKLIVGELEIKDDVKDPASLLNDIMEEAMSKYKEELMEDAEDFRNRVIEWLKDN